MIKHTSYNIDLNRLKTELVNFTEENKGTAFEVEDVNQRENYVFKHIEEENIVEMWETTDWENVLLRSFPEGDLFPFGCKNSSEYFDTMFKKSKKIDMQYPIVFIGWVNPKTFQPIEQN